MSQLAPRYGKYQGVVESYNGNGRMCRVLIPSQTDGSNVALEAVFCNPLGDRPEDTEIRILAGDKIWIEFEAGDERFPIITGYRTPREGNPVDWRRWQHKNIELTAEETLIINATNVVWNVSGNFTKHVAGDDTTDVGGAMGSTAGTSTHQSATHEITAQTAIIGNTAITGGLATDGSAGGVGVTMKGPIAIVDGTVTHNGVNIGSTHQHTEMGDGLDVSVPH